MQRTYTKPADSKESRPKTAGEVKIENLKKDGSKEARQFLKHLNKKK